MPMISVSERLFVKECIESELRLDTRGLLHRRPVVYSDVQSPMLASMVKAVAGQTIIYVSVAFRSVLGRDWESNPGCFKYTTLGKVHSRSTGLISSGLSHILAPGAGQGSLGTALRDADLEIEIETEVLNDDGGVLGLFFGAFMQMLKDFPIPNVRELPVVTPGSFSLPSVDIYAVFGKVLALDPLLIEELSADGILVVVSGKDGVDSVFADGCIDEYVLNECLGQIKRVL